MTITQLLGLALVSLPFLLVFAVITLQDGWAVALGLFAATALLWLVVAVGVRLLAGEQ